MIVSNFFDIFFYNIHFFVEGLFWIIENISRKNHILKILNMSLNFSKSI